MGDNIDSTKTTNINNISSNNNSVNTKDVNMTLNNMPSANSLTVSDRIKLLNKASSFTSENSVKSTKSSKSVKSEKPKKKSKVKNMIKILEKHIIHNGKKEKNDMIGEVNDNPVDVFETTIEEQEPIQKERITEVNNNENIVEQIEDINGKEKIDNIKTEPIVIEQEKETSTEIVEDKQSINEVKEESKEEKVDSFDIVEEKEPTEVKIDSVKVEENVETTEDDKNEYIRETEKTIEEKIENIETEEKEEIAEVNDEDVEAFIEKEETIKQKIRAKIAEYNNEIIEEMNTNEEKEEIMEEEFTNIEEKEETTEEKVEEVKVKVENEEAEEETIEEKVENIEKEETAEVNVESAEVFKEETIEGMVETVETDEKKEETDEEKVESVEAFKEKEETVEEKVEIVEAVEKEEETVEEKVESLEAFKEKEEKEETIKEKVEIVEIEEKEETIEVKDTSNKIKPDFQLVKEGNIIETSLKDNNSEYLKKDSIISQLSHVITTDTESTSDNDSSLLSVDPIEGLDNIEIKNVSGNNDLDQPLQATIVDLSNENFKDSSSDGSLIAEDELNGFTNALQSINNINNAEKQFLIPNPEALDEMINKSLKSNSRIDSMNLSFYDSLNVNLSEKHDSYQSHHSNNSHQSQQSGSGVHHQIAPPQPPPHTPLPPTPQGPVPPYLSLGEARESDSQSISSIDSKKGKGHFQHLSLGRLTEVINDDDENQQKSRSNRSSKLSVTDNSTPLSSSVQTVTIQSVTDSSSIRTKKRNKNTQPLQAVVFNNDSEEDTSINTENGQPLKAEVQTIEDTEEILNTSEAPTEEEKKKEKGKEVEKTESSQNIIKDKADAFKTSSKKLKDTFSNIENLLEDLDSQIQNLKTPKLKAIEQQDGYEGDDEIRYNKIKKDKALAATRRNQGLINSYPPENPSIDMIARNKNRPVSSYSRQSYYTESVMSDDPDILPLPAVIEGGPMSPESVHDITIQNTIQNLNSINATVPLVNNNYNNSLYNVDDEFDIDQSLNNNLKILKSSGKQSSIKDIPIINRKNPTPSPVISTKALKLVGVENHSIPNMSAKALKMLGMNAPSENDFANFQFDERELAMLNAAPTTSPHLMNKGHGRNGSASSKTLNDDYMAYPSKDMGMNMNLNISSMNERSMPLEDLEEDDDIFMDVNEDEMIRDPSMLTMGSVKSNNSFNSTSSYSMSQKAMKVFGISEHDLKGNSTIVNNKVNPMSPHISNVGLSPHQQFSVPMDNLNLSRYSINDGENQINGIISSKALKIIGLEDTSSTTAASTTPNKKPDYLENKKGPKVKREKMKEFEEVKEASRNMMPTLASLKKPILTDNLYFNNHGLLKGWKKRFTVLTQDNWIYSFSSNDPKSHALIAIPINSNTVVDEYFDPINIVPYFVEIISNWPVESETKRYITIGCDNKQKCQSWLTSIKSLIARDKFSNAKLPPKPTTGMDDDLDIGNVNINPGPARSPLMNSGFRSGRPLTMNGSSMVGDLGSLYDGITGYNSNAASGIERSHSYGEKPLTSPLIASINGQANIIKKPPTKNIRVTKHPVRKESFKSRYSSMIGSPNAMNAMNGNRTPRQSTIPMISSSPLLKGQYSPYSPNKAINSFGLTSPSLPPMTLPASTSSASVISTPKSIGGSSYRRSPFLGAEPVNPMTSLILSPKQKPINMVGSPYLGGYNQNQFNVKSPMEDMMDYETMQKQRMIQQEELIKQQQQQILILQKQLLKNQQEMEQGFMEMPKDKNY